MITGFLCGPRLYEYGGWAFEWGAHNGPWPHRKDGELRARAGRKFWKMIDRFEKEPNREFFRAGGGCQAIGGNAAGK